MHLYLYIFFYYLFLPQVLSKQIEITCPEHCKCDIFETLRRATCTNRNLAKIESNIPQQTQLLDLSYNQIEHIDNNIFLEEKLLSLKLLNISHNKLGQIEMKAFEGLTSLKTLDLSYNGVQYILKEWFKSFGSLQELYLRGNSFSKLDGEPKINSKTLTRLDLSACRISFIGHDTFQELPNLEILDISDNYLIHLSAVTIKPLTNLNILNVNNISLSCDGEFEELLDYCTQNGIRFTSSNSCNKGKILETEKFQRMINTAEPNDEKNSWIYDDEEETKNDNETKIIPVCNNTRADKSLLQEIVDLSPFLSIMFPFIYGISVGILIAYIVHTCTERKKDTTGSTYLSFEDSDAHLQRRRTRHNRMSAVFNRSASTEDRQSLPMREWNISESTPVLFRKKQIIL